MTKPGRRLRNQVLSTLLRGLTQGFRALTWRGAQRVGVALGWIGWYVAPRDRDRILRHLRIAFPQATDGERRRLGHRSLCHHGASLAECLYLLRHDCATVARHVEIRGWESVEAARSAGRPLLILTGHCGNWELLAAAINCLGLRMRVVARELTAPGFQRLLLAFRSRFGTETIPRGSPGAARRLLQTLREGGALGMLIDQDTRVEGVWIPFFGRPAFTPLAAAQLAGRHQTVVIPAFIERLPDGSHLARFQPALELPDDPTEATAVMHACIEAQIRHAPEQWVWMHRRWRRRPERPNG